MVTIWRSNVVENDLENDLENLSENQSKILQCIKENPYVTQTQISEFIGITPKNVRNNISRLKQLGLLVRIGPDKGGRWQVKNGK